MTYGEIIKRLKLGVDKIDSSITGEISIQEFCTFLNIGIERFIKQRYGINNLYNTSFEETQKRTDELSEILKYTKLNPTYAGFFNTNNVGSVYYTLPTDYWISIIERVTLDLGLITTTHTDECDVDTVNENSIIETSMVTPIRHGELNTILEDPYNKPVNCNTSRVIVNKKIQLFYDINKVDPKEYLLGYIAKPEKVVFNTTFTKENAYTTEFWMSDISSQEIIDITIQYILEIIESPRIKTHIYNTQKQE